MKFVLLEVNVSRYEYGNKIQYCLLSLPHLMILCGAGRRIGEVTADFESCISINL